MGSIPGLIFWKIICKSLCHITFYNCQRVHGSSGNNTAGSWQLFVFFNCPNVLFPHFVAMCSTIEDYLNSWCPLYDLENCLNPAIVTSCPIVAYQRRLPCVRYICEVCNFSFVSLLACDGLDKVRTIVAT